MTTTRLLLPFTGSINALALSHAVQLAVQRQATLVPLALIRVKPNKAARLERIQQAQDFLEFARCKAERQGVQIEQARVYTSDVARSIEAVAGEMNCEAVIIFLSATEEVFLEPAEIRELMDRAACNAHIVLLPSRRERKHPLHIPLLKRSLDERKKYTESGALISALMQERTPLIYQLTPDDHLN
jgi:hypothetical protein